MKALEEDMRVTLTILRRHINPLESPLYRLPPDLFPEVASHFTSEMDLVNATHVSYYLRNTLLSHPSLWSHLNFECEMRARAFSERSGQTSLHINMAREPGQMVDSLVELRQQSKRIATLKLRHWSIQKKFLSEPLPSLRWLEIFAEYYDDKWNKSWDTWTPVWGPTEEATSWSFPSLTSLSVRRLDPTPFYTPLLTRFKFWDEDALTSIDKLLSFLHNCPLLEHVDILSGGRWNEQDPIVSLPNLRTYKEITLNNQCSLTVLNMLSLPPFCSVTLMAPNDGTRAGTEGLLPDFKNPDYLADTKRVKLRTAHDDCENHIVEALELINAEGTRVCVKGLRVAGESQPHNVAHLKFLRSLDGWLVEVLCIDGYARPNSVTEFLGGALDFGNVGTLILSGGAEEQYLLALDKDLSTGGHNRWSSPVHTLIIRPYSDSDRHLHDQLLHQLLSIAQRREMAGSPFKSVSLFLSDFPGEESEVALEELRKCVERLEVVNGDDALDWDVDEYFLDGLDHLQKSRDVQWD